MEKRKQQPHALQWHPAFYAGIQIELEAEADLLLFENEHQLGTKPKEIDVLIVKKERDVSIRKNIGRIFRTHNTVEYKSPKDYLSVDDFYKVYGYTCFYKADTAQADSIAIHDITITFVCHRYPRSLMRHLTEERGYEIHREEDGIYYINGDNIPIQLILTKELSEEQNLWLKSLTDELEETETAKHLIEQYGKHKGNNLYKSVMDLIVRANKDKFKEAKIMCEALEELMEDELEAKRTQGLAEGLALGKAKGLALGEALGKAESIVVLLKDLGDVSEKLQRNIMEQNDTEILNQWLKYAARAKTIRDFEQKIQ